MPKAEAVAPEVRRGIQTSKVTLAPKEIVVPFEIGDNFLELNLEGKSVEERIIRMMATQFANDIEELYLRGDILGEAALEGDLVEGGSGTQYIKDNYLALFDGWLRLADRGHRVDIEGGQVGSAVFSKLLNAMPNKFKRDRANLRFLTSPELEQDFRQHVATRQTAAATRPCPRGATPRPSAWSSESVAVPHRPVIVEHLASGRDDPDGPALPAGERGGREPERPGKTAQAAFAATTDYTVDEAAARWPGRPRARSGTGTS